MPPFSPRTARASAAGFDGIAWAYQSATRKRPLISCRLGVSKQCASFFLSPFASSSATSVLTLAPRVRARFAGDDGEGQDIRPGAREEGGGAGEREEVRSGRILLKVCSAPRLDPRRLDAVGDPARRSRRHGRGGVIPHEAVRLPGREIEPQPRDGECVLLATHVDRGFSLPPHPFSGAS